MKILLLAFAVLFLCAPTTAQETKSFTDMTLEELQQVDQSSLEKKQKREVKKLIKAAKKEIKKAEKARKKAEKARKKEEKRKARAEAKRLKVVEKARKKHNKKIQKQLDFINKTYSKTSISKDDFEAYVSIIAPLNTDDFSFLGPSSSSINTRHRLRAYYYPKTNKLSLQLLISQRVLVTSITSETIGSIRNPLTYVTRNGLWPNFSRATMRGGAARKLTPIEQYHDDCEMFQCNFREVVSIKLHADDIITSVTTNQPMEFKVSNRSGEYLLEEVPAAYTLGFLKKLGNLNSAASIYSDAAATAENNIRNMLQ